jgi:ribonuclease G
VSARFANAKIGDCVYEDLSLPLRSVRDHMRSNIEKVRVDSRETFDRLMRVRARSSCPPGRSVSSTIRASGRSSISTASRTKSSARLKQGSAVEVGRLPDRRPDRGDDHDRRQHRRLLGTRNLEETVYRTNLEAAQAVARQLRLRNLGGIIIIDFIDMTDEEHKRQVLRQLEKALTRDHAKTTVYEMSPLGLVEMTRKRTTESLERQLCEPCPACAGRGTLKTAETVCYEIFREITRAVRQFDAERLLVLAAPKVVSKILDEESAAVAELEEFIGKTISFQPEDQYSQEQYDVVVM